MSRSATRKSGCRGTGSSAVEIRWPRTSTTRAARASRRMAVTGVSLSRYIGHDDTVALIQPDAPIVERPFVGHLLVRLAAVPPASCKDRWRSSLTALND